MLGYGASLSLGIGIPIPIIDEEMMSFVSIKDEDIYAPVIDYSSSYPKRENEILTKINYRDLRSGMVTIKGKKVTSASLSSYPMASEIARTLKNWIVTGKFQLTGKVASLPGVESGQTFKSLEIKTKRGG